jgi:2-keto-4-pentenoate hydratase
VAFDAAAAAARLLEARREGLRVPWREVTPPGRAQAYAVQDATLARLGLHGAWKVDAHSPGAEPCCAPLPAAGVVDTACELRGPAFGLRGIEVEVAVRLSRGFEGVDAPPPAEAMRAAVDAVLPAIEVVESRLDGWQASDPLAAFADLQSHGALVLGEPRPVPPGLDLREVVAYLAFDGQPVASARGANGAGDLWRLLAWLAWHAARRGMPLRAGDVVTTGSCSGLLFAPEGARVQADLQGVGQVELRF